MDTQSQKLSSGLLGGLAGGLIFGLVMWMMGILPMIAMLFGGESAIIGFMVHLVFSAIFGFAFAVILGEVTNTVSEAVAYGLVYGVALWVLGPLLIMPLWLGMGAQFSFAGMSEALPSLWGHLIYGLVLGLAYVLLTAPTTIIKAGKDGQ